MSKDRGWFAVSRDIFEDDLFADEPLTEREAWNWLKKEAKWKPCTVRAKSGRAWQMVDLIPGQLCLSLRFMQTAWRWNSDHRVRTFLNKLIVAERIEVRTDAQMNVVTICNNVVFQEEQSEGAHNGRTNGAQTGAQSGAQTGTQTDAVNTCNDDTNRNSTEEPGAQTGAQTGEQDFQKRRKPIERNNSKKEDIVRGFDEFWSEYPRKAAKQVAFKAYEGVIGSGKISHEALLECARVYAAQRKALPAKDQEFTLHASTWLNQERYTEARPLTGVAAPVVRDPGTYTDAQWQSRMNYYRAGNPWLDSWGPEFGSPGCLVPSHIAAGPSQ